MCCISHQRRVQNMSIQRHSGIGSAPAAVPKFSPGAVGVIDRTPSSPRTDLSRTESTFDTWVLCADMSAVALLHTVALAAARTGEDPKTTAHELIRAAGAADADADALAAASRAIDQGHPVLAVARELIRVLHADVDTLAADVFTIYAEERRRDRKGRQLLSVPPR